MLYYDICSYKKIKRKNINFYNKMFECNTSQAYILNVAFFEGSHNIFYIEVKKCITHKQFNFILRLTEARKKTNAP